MELQVKARRGVEGLREITFRPVRRCEAVAQVQRLGQADDEPTQALPALKWGGLDRHGA